MKTYHAYSDAETAGQPGLHGGKGAGLIDMATVGLPVPKALILTTDAWAYYREHDKLPVGVEQAICDTLGAYPDSMFSVRSGAPVSMPGMMDTVLNVGVDPEIDKQYPGAFRRFTTSWLEIVKGIPKERTTLLMERVAARVEQEKATNPAHRSTALLAAVVNAAEQVTVPEDRFTQVVECVKAVFKSWDTPRAIAYRKMHDIPDDMGTGCIIQRMVMGTAPGLSGSGVMFSRNPATGEPGIKGEIAFNAQGEEVVSGEITPIPLSTLLSCSEEKAYLYGQLVDLAMQLEGHFGDVQDIEFTVENGVLYVLQTRTAKMSARARIDTAVSLAETNFPKAPETQLAYVKHRVTRGLVQQTRVPLVDTEEPIQAVGLATSPGAISGTIVFRTTPLSKVTKDCILVAEDTAPEDFPIMAQAGGILTKTGGFTCHSAVVARGIGVPAVVGVDDLKFTKTGWVDINGDLFQEGAYITIDGTAGDVYGGQHPVKKQQPPRSIYEFLHSIVKTKGVHVEPDTYYYDCGIGDRVALPINPSDLEHAEVQLDRAATLKAKGKIVGIAFEMEGTGEDMFSLPPEIIFKELAECYSEKFKGFPIIYGVPSNMGGTVQQMLGVTVNVTEEVRVLDLLDLLGAKA